MHGRGTAAIRRKNWALAAGKMLLEKTAQISTFATKP
jgi:hypothetical protein